MKFLACLVLLPDRVLAPEASRSLTAILQAAVQRGPFGRSLCRSWLFGSAGWLGRAILSQARSCDRIRAFNRDPAAWDQWRDIDGDWAGEALYGDSGDFAAVEAAVAGMEAAIHTAVCFPRPRRAGEPAPLPGQPPGAVECAGSGPAAPGRERGACRSLPGGPPAGPLFRRGTPGLRKAICVASASGSRRRCAASSTRRIGCVPSCCGRATSWTAAWG